tara:strand:+ start:584 stop:1600 length:1017 start_codon:yes stop_codon:yes gene_type:complete
MKTMKSFFYRLSLSAFFFLVSFYAVFASVPMDVVERGEGFSQRASTFYPVTFPREHRWPRAKVSKERVDLTGLSFITIDPEGARDLDDALYVEEGKKGGYHIAIAIADPTYYIQPHSPVAQEARNRGFTVYGEGTPVPMLPQKLVHVCSLGEGKKRPAVIVDLFIDKNGAFKGEPSIYRALVRSQHKLSYRSVNDIYRGRWFSVINPHLKKKLFILQGAAQALKSYYSKDEEALMSQDVVSEFMVTANNAVAMHLKKMVVESRIKKAVFRAQGDVESRAFYTSESSFHASFDLIYTHFTSPLRRYADMMVHWLLFHPGYTFSKTALDYMGSVAKKVRS